MFGRKQEHERRDEKEWRLAMGTVGESRLHDQDWSYRVDYRRAAGGMSRATVRALPDRNVELAIGTRIALQENVRTGEVLMHTEQPRRAADAVHLARERRGQDPGAAGAAALAGLFQAGGAEVRVTGEPKVHVVGGAQAAEVMEAVQELMRGGGDPATARERIRQLKADLQAQAGMAAPAAPARPEGFASAEPEGFSSAGPSTFDSVVSPPPVTPTTFSSPDPSVGQPTPAFGPPGFSPVAPATTFSSPAAAGSFSPGSATGSGAFGAFGGFGESKSDRIAQLEDQRDRGQITPEQFAAQRQQIQDEI
jgi:hypothetical protein